MRRRMALEPCVPIPIAGVAVRRGWSIASFLLHHVLAALLLLPVLATAAPLSAELLTDDLHLRKRAPIPLEIRLTNHTQTIIEGRLELTILRGGSVAGIHRSGEVVIQPGKRVIALPLPPVPEAEEGDGIGAQIRFIGKSGAFDLGQQQIGILALGANELILAIPRTGRRLVEMDTARERSIRLETLRPALDKAPWLSISTVATPITVEQMPVHPLGWCAYDAVLLDGAAFAKSGAKSLSSLARWVEGGGSVFVCLNDPDAAEHGEHHIEFLRRLAKGEPGITFSTGPDGRISSAGGSGDPVKLRVGLGRAVISAVAPLDRDGYKRKAWREAVAWLWKMRAIHLDEIATNGVLENNWAEQGQADRAWEGEQIDWAWDAANGFSALTPGAPRQLPLPVVAGVLALLLVLIGPGDWMMLGWLRKRRWTWFAFPILCAGFAWWMAHLSGKYLGVADRTGSVRLVDVGMDGQVLREIRYELLFPANDREWTLDLRDAIAVPVPRPSPRLNPAVAPPAIAAPMNSPTSPSVSEWSSPGRFTLRRKLRQWTPALVRVTAFPEAKDDSGIDWAAVASGSEKREIGPGATGPDSSIGAWKVMDTLDGLGAGEFEMDNAWQIQGNGAEMKPTEAQLMRQVFARRLRGSMSGLVGRWSPQVSGDLNDARTFAAGEPRALVVWRREKNAIHIYRLHVDAGQTGRPQSPGM